MSNIQNHSLFSVWSASKHTLVIVLTKDLKKCQRWRRGISLQGSGPPTTCEILHQLISHNVIKHNKSHSAAAPFSSTEPTSAGNTQLFSTATYHMSQPQLYSSLIKTDFFFFFYMRSFLLVAAQVCGDVELCTDRTDHLYVGRVGSRLAASQSLIRPVTQASQWFSCSLPQHPDNSSPALRAASECPSDPCGTPAPPAAGTSSFSPAPSGSSARHQQHKIHTGEVFGHFL